MPLGLLGGDLDRELGVRDGCRVDLDFDDQLRVLALHRDEDDRDGRDDGSGDELLVCDDLGELLDVH